MRIPWRSFAILMGVLALALPGCSSTPSATAAVVQPVVLVVPRVPDRLRVCAVHPVAGNLETEEDLRYHLIALAFAGDDCRQTLASVVRLIEAAERQAEGGQ